MNLENETPIEPLQEHRKKQLELEELIEENRELERLLKIKKLKERNEKIKNQLDGKVFCDDCGKWVFLDHFK